MKKCEYCGRENEDIALNCGECGTEFDTVALPEGGQAKGEPGVSLVTVATFPNTVDGELFKMHLQGAGIEACAPEEFSPLEPVTVRVAAKDVEAAKALYAAFPHGSRDRAVPPSLPETVGIDS